MQIDTYLPRTLQGLRIIAALMLFTMSGHTLIYANEVMLIKIKVKPGKIKAPCPVTLNFSAYILADEFGDIKYRWIRSDEEQMPVKTLSLPANKRKRGGTVEMNWDASPVNSPKGRKYWADIEIISPDSLGSSGRANAFVLCDGLIPSNQASNADSQSENRSGNDVSKNDSGPVTRSAGDDLFDFGGAEEQEDIIVGEGGEPGSGPAIDLAPLRPAPQPIEFACPVKTIGVQVSAALPNDWQKDSDKLVATATLKTHLVVGTQRGARLKCVYQNGRWLIPLTRPVPEGYTECKRISNFFFRCTG